MRIVEEIQNIAPEHRSLDKGSLRKSEREPVLSRMIGKGDEQKLGAGAGSSTARCPNFFATSHYGFDH